MRVCFLRSRTEDQWCLFLGGGISEKRKVISKFMCSYNGFYQGSGRKCWEKERPLGSWYLKKSA
jgi:hypothetical protein